MTGNSFFDESQEQSQVKAEIVAKYFWAWAKVIIPSQKGRGNKIAYIDLFAGPGRYKDGTKSTPLLVLERAIQDPDMREMLVTIFNDADSNNTQTLCQAIDSIPGIKVLRHKPQVYNALVGEEIVKMFEQMRLVPTLFFVDPWGYKGLSLRLINLVLKDWGCDCIVFFNYNRINMGFNNESVKEHMNALFGKERADKLREQLEPMRPHKRELTIVEALAEALKEMGGEYVLPFRFKNGSGNRTSHHLVFVSKHIKGYEIMKEIMAKESSSAQQGVPSFEYNPATRSQPLLFDLSRPLDDLEGMLLNDFASRKMTMLEVYNQHHVGTPYIKSNYKDVLARLEAQGKVSADPPADQQRRRKGESTFADTVTVMFPSKGNI
ncbi:MAG: three-Cys-motif partner protein TcmP [Chloroflexi bacterium]|nr:three-Cys-motif partner protein TcmP [Chloroflexota bacterium]MCL5074869.1 three-Cys-motif partner protein TcmP [Chloroflexota bacterium]